MNKLFNILMSNCDAGHIEIEKLLPLLTDRQKEKILEKNRTEHEKN